MTCAHCRGVEATFDDQAARRDLEDLKRHGPAETTRWLIDELSAQDVAGLTVMDIGGGLGALGAGLLESGARSVTLVEASTAFLNLARREARGAPGRWIDGVCAGRLRPTGSRTRAGGRRLPRSRHLLLS